MNKERLLTLAKFLASKKVDPTRFDMDFWVNEPGVDQYGVPIECGFAGCAMGWANFIPEFRQLGYRLGTPFSNPAYWEPAIEDQDGHTQYGLSAALTLFELDPDEYYYVPNKDTMTGADLASHLFGGSEPGYTTPRQVANRIRKIVKAN